MIYSDKAIYKAILTKQLHIEPLSKSIIQPSSIDLQVGDRIWQVAGVPNLATGFDPENFVTEYTLNHFTPELVRSGEPTLLPGTVYLVELKQQVRFPKEVWGYINPKSSAGRIDLFCMVLARGSVDFNVVPQGYSGPLYMLVIPQSFPVRALYGQSFVQMRLYEGPREYLNKNELEDLHESFGLTTNSNAEPDITEEGLLLHLDVTIKPHALVAVQGGKPLLLTERGSIDPRVYFREKPLDSQKNLFLEPQDFLLAATTETVRIPPGVCAEMLPYRQEHGELRSHYAGFFDPGFGYGKNGEVPGSSAVCEIRNIGMVPQLLSHNQMVSMFRYEWISSIPQNVYGDETIQSNYQGQQGIRLAKYFSSWNWN